jgi:hypothetical protein
VRAFAARSSGELASNVQRGGYLHLSSAQDGKGWSMAHLTMPSRQRWQGTSRGVRAGGMAAKERRTCCCCCCCWCCSADEGAKWQGRGGEVVVLVLLLLVLVLVKGGGRGRMMLQRSKGVELSGKRLLLYPPYEGYSTRLVAQ